MLRLISEMASGSFRSGYGGVAACLLTLLVASVVFALAAVVTALYWLAMCLTVLSALAAAMGTGS